MPSISSPDIFLALKQKQKELQKLDKLIGKANLIAKLDAQAAPSPGLEVEGASYLGEVSELCELANELKLKLDAIVNMAKANGVIKSEQLTEIIRLSAEFKDKKRSSFGKMTALKTNPAYEKMRRKSGGKIAEISGLIDNTDSLLVGLGNELEVQPIIEREMEVVNKERVMRNYVKTKQELADSEETFKQDMTKLTVMSAQHSFVRTLKENEYPKMAEFIGISGNLLDQSKIVSPLFKQAMDDPSVLMTPQAKRAVQKYYALLTDASILKTQIDQEEIQRFSQDQSPAIAKLNSTFESMDQRGLYAYMGMPFQRVGRHPILMKAVFESISNKDNSAPIFPEHQAAWDVFQDQTEMMKRHTVQSNQALRNFLEGEQAPAKGEGAEMLPGLPPLAPLPPLPPRDNGADLPPLPPRDNRADLPPLPARDHGWSRVAPSSAAKEQKQNREVQSAAQAGHSVEGKIERVPWKRREPNKENVKPRDFNQTQEASSSRTIPPVPLKAPPPVPRVPAIAPRRALLKRTEATRNLVQKNRGELLGQPKTKVTTKRPKRKD